MKRVLRLLLVLLVVSLFAFGLRHELKKRAQARREAAYQSALRSYTEVLKPVMTRKEVEDYLHGRSVQFRQMCCVDAMELSKRKSWDDLVKIGEESAPWFCSENNVYLAFQFIDDGKQQTNWWKADDLDTLKSITIYHWLEGCL
jgi:hypothetical protein